MQPISNQLRLRNMQPQLLLLILSWAALLTGCGQLSSLQTGRVLEQGQVNAGGALLGYGLVDSDSNASVARYLLLPHAEAWARLGLGARMDVGLKLSTGGNALLDGRYQFLGGPDGKWAMAAGLGFEYQYSNPSENVVFRGHLPVYLSYHPSEKSAVYATPRFVYQYVSDDDPSYFLGSSLGYLHRFSDGFSGLVEGSLYKPQTVGSSNQNLLYQFGIGVAFHLKR